jgi:DNA-binding Lrp family transcriptional regulator
MVFGFMAAGEREHTMDAVDQAILRRLQRDGRQTNRELAEALGIAPSTALERTRALRARGVITGFHAAVDLAALGRGVQALISIRIRPQSREAIETVRDNMAQLPETLGVFVVTGNEDVLVHVAVPSTQYLRDFVLDRLARRKEFVDVRTTVVFDYVQPAEQSELPDGISR